MQQHIPGCLNTKTRKRGHSIDSTERQGSSRKTLIGYSKIRVSQRVHKFLKVRHRVIGPGCKAFVERWLDVQDGRWKEKVGGFQVSYTVWRASKGPADSSRRKSAGMVSKAQSRGVRPPGPARKIKSSGEGRVPVSGIEHHEKKRPMLDAERDLDNKQ